VIPRFAGKLHQSRFFWNDAVRYAHPFHSLLHHKYSMTFTVSSWGQTHVSARIWRTHGCAPYQPIRSCRIILRNNRTQSCRGDRRSPSLPKRRPRQCKRATAGRPYKCIMTPNDFHGIIVGTASIEVFSNDAISYARHILLSY
jgi:hypothetical protein